ncbi:uncharacterized protein [Drosophila kikkawai]|uniref:Uncharacterized protein n=1 Tax=Drosophila kikkawai TaxID=30033 RepID=A0ABM4GH92_DROKI
MIRRLPLADPKFGAPGKIDVILGADQLWNIYTGHRREFGSYTDCNEASTQAQVHHAYEDLDSLVRSFMDMEQEPIMPIGSTLPQALNRFAALERKFQKFPALKQQYVDFMEDYLRRGHMELIPAAAAGEDPARYNYLAHHAVFKPDSTTTRCRVVFDGSGKDSKGHSLNSRLHIGPTGSTWIWKKEETATLDHYRLLTVTYGLASSPFIAVRVLKQLAADYAGM